MKDPLIYLAGCVAVLVFIVALVYFDPATGRRDQVDTLSLGPWVVQKLEDQIPVFLCMESVRESIRVYWSALPEDAWKYADRESAEVDAERMGGVARSLKVIVAEVVR